MFIADVCQLVKVWKLAEMLHLPEVTRYESSVESRNVERKAPKIARYGGRPQYILYSIGSDLSL